LVDRRWFARGRIGGLSAGPGRGTGQPRAAHGASARWALQTGVSSEGPVANAAVRIGIALCGVDEAPLLRKVAVRGCSVIVWRSRPRFGLRDVSGACTGARPGSDGIAALAVGSGISTNGRGLMTSCGASEGGGSGSQASSHGWRPETGGLPAVSQGAHPAARFGIKVLCQGDRDTGPADQRPSLCGRPQGLGDASGSHPGLGKPGSARPGAERRQRPVSRAIVCAGPVGANAEPTGL